MQCVGRKGVKGSIATHSVPRIGVGGCRRLRIGVCKKSILSANTPKSTLATKIIASKGSAIALSILHFEVVMVKLLSHKQRLWRIFSMLKTLKNVYAPKKAFRCVFVTNCFPQGITFGHVSPSFCAKVFFTVFLLKYTFCSARSLTHAKNDVCFYARQNDDRNCRFQKLRILLKLGKNKKQKNQLSKRSSDKYSLLHTGF